MNCQYCGRDFLKGAKMHEKYCKENPENIKRQERSPAFTHVAKEFTASSEPKTDVPLSENKPTTEQKRTKLYLILVALFVIAGVVQYFLFSWLQLHWIFLIVVWVVDLLILVFLLWTVYRLRQKQEPVIFKDLEDFLQTVPKWAIDEKSPKSGIIGSILNKGKDYKQIVLFSEHFEPKSIWSEWDGFMFRNGNRAYVPPRDVRGDIFPYHVDKKECLIDTAKATQEDAEDSYHLLAVWNQAFSVGHAAAMNETQQQIKMILIIVAIILIAVIGLALYQYGQFEGINQKFILAEKLINQIAAEGVKTKV